MHHFAYRDGVLHAEAVNLDTLAAAVGTPFYCYSTATLTRHYQVFADAFADVHALVCYAMKANSNQAIVTTLARLGAGADVVSGGELKRARLAGIPPERSCSPVSGKTASSSRVGGRRRIPASMLNREASSGYCIIDCSPQRHVVCARFIRVNPTSTPRRITKDRRGKAENKFGIRSAALARFMHGPPS
jgi:diaminopimelate decarboxylase